MRGYFSTDCRLLDDNYNGPREIGNFTVPGAKNHYKDRKIEK